MPKRVFWPIAMIVMGVIFLASNTGLLPKSFWQLWPLMLIAVGLGGLVTSDRDQWMGDSSDSAKITSPMKKMASSSTMSRSKSAMKPAKSAKSAKKTTTSSSRRPHTKSRSK